MPEEVESPSHEARSFPARVARSRSKPAGWTPRLYRPGDEAQILPLYPRAFQGLQRSEAYWRWKFHDNPAGRCLIVAESPGGRILGILGGLPARVHATGRTVVVSQVVEAMLAPDGRRGLRKAGLFVTLLATLVDEVMTKGGAAFMFALPNQDSDGIHATVDARFFHQVTRVVRPLEGGRPSASAWLGRARYRVRRLEGFGAESDGVWERCRPTFPLATIRDARYLAWRYQDCPLVPYQAYLAWDRWRDRPAGLAVVRMGWEGQPLCALVDWLVPRDDPAAAPVLLAHLEGLAQQAGMRDVAAWFFPGGPEEQWFARQGYRVEPTSYPLVVRATNPDFPSDWIARHWYYTMGDSDIF